MLIAPVDQRSCCYAPQADRQQDQRIIKILGSGIAYLVFLMRDHFYFERPKGKCVIQMNCPSTDSAK